MKYEIPWRENKDSVDRSAVYLEEVKLWNENSDITWSELNLSMIQYRKERTDEDAYLIIIKEDNPFLCIFQRCISLKIRVERYYV